MDSIPLMKHSFLLFIFAICATSELWAQEDLPSLHIRPGSITVSGVSSGAFMSVQLQVAHSEIISGAASVSGGVFWCAKGNSLDAQIDCMGLPKSDVADEYIKKAQELEKAGAISPLSNLKTQKAFIFSSQGDNIIKQKNGDRLQNFYKAFMPEANIIHRKHLTAAHGFPTVDYGNDCNQGKSPWILNCNLDLAGDIFSTFYGTLRPKVSAVTDNLKTFSQKIYDPEKNLLYQSGWIYVPSSCQQGGICSLHVALHGCQMSPDFIADQFVKHAGYNEWAESNHIVVLYPQTIKGPRNPQGCWDWFGMTGQDYISQKGPQIEALYRMIRTVAK